MSVVPALSLVRVVRVCQTTPVSIVRVYPTVLHRTSQIRLGEQVVSHQPAISFSISFQPSFNRAGGRTFDVRQIMKSHITVITLGVDILERAVAFYRDGLGLSTKGIIGLEFEHGAVAFFDLQHGMKLAVWPRNSIAHDTGLPPSSPSSTEFTLGHNVSSREEVDTVMLQAKQAGANIIKEPQDTFWGGYSGYFLDPDSHLWEIVWNPNYEEL